MRRGTITPKHLPPLHSATMFPSMGNVETATQTGNDIRNNQHTFTNTVYNSRNSIALRLNELASDTTTEFNRQKNDIPYIKHWIQTEKTRLASYMTQN